MEKTWFEKLGDEIKDSFDSRLARMEIEVTERILEVMEEKKVTRAELARRLHVSPPVVTAFFRRGSNATMARLLKIADVLDLDLSIQFQGKKVDSREKPFEKMRIAG